MDVTYDVVVIGAGHAGVEAAAAAARIGSTVALVSPGIADAGTMSCNPSIGGIGKGHLVREIDALGGIMGTAADRAAIHRRMLNRSKGPAVWGPRVQADRHLFASAVQASIRGFENIQQVRLHATDLLLQAGRVRGVVAGDTQILTRAVVIASGTFLRGRLHQGMAAFDGGRAGAGASTRLADRLRDLVGGPLRGKTGTPPRIDGRTIDWARLERQASDRERWWMGLDQVSQPSQVHCAIAHTNEATHAMIEAAADQSPLYSGRIEGHGPRYCPSIEDKVRRFSDRASHQVFLEPEGLADPTIYPNGLSTSLPADVQQGFLRTIEGLESASITVPGYAVEYDFYDPRHLDRSLSCREIAGLFFAGQVNGTTGYEEAAAQGIVAGIAAAHQSRGREPCVFDRKNSYLGVMVDDLTLQGVDEPYRMLTARSEMRLHLRADNAEARLGELAAGLGLLSFERRQGYERRAEARAGSGSITLPESERAMIEAELATDRLYAPYVKRQQAENARVQREERLRLNPSRFDRVSGLSNEMRERLLRANPSTLGEAKRIKGITPAALASLLLSTHAE